ncbi:MAG TPA: phosphatidate cytidylyltransferase [Phycisphaerales bacterium]|nr:phosphatidate cytidylyltransferase [Phycisphaerales bacterium]
MVKRLLLGPVMILLVLVLCTLDQWLDRLPTPAGLAWLLGGPTLPPGIVVAVICNLLAFGGAYELAEMLRKKGVLASSRLAGVSALLGMLAMTTALVPTMRDLTAPAMASAAALSLVLAQIVYSRGQTVAGAITSSAGTVLGVIYLGFMLGCLLLIRAEHSVWVMMWALLTTKSSDIGAYFTGRAMGRNKLILWLSPGKTWEGLVGGTLFAGLVGIGGLWLIDRWTDVAVPPLWTGFIAGMLFSLVGQLGDLGESLYKRDAGMKDSGQSLPGFGGLLDVLDSLILVSPVAYWWLRIVHPAFEPAAP